MMGYRYDYGYDMMGGGWLGDLLMLLFGVLVIAGIVLVVVWAVQTAGARKTPNGSGTAPPAPGHDEAIAVARRRFATGEITKEQYEDILHALGG